MHRTIDNVFELYGLALSAGQTFAQQYWSAARAMRAAGDDDAADLFECIEELECAQALQIDHWTRGASLPRVDIREYCGECGVLDMPRLRAATCHEDVLGAVIKAELALRTCYTRLAASSEDEQVRAVAAALASARDRHVWRVRRILSRPFSLGVAAEAAIPGAIFAPA
jgi:hypothetical protein